MPDPNTVAAVYDRRSTPTAVIDRRDSRFVSLPARGASGLVWIYQKTLSPALVALNPACGCRFAPTCSHYARAALREHGLLLGLFFTLRRLVKCGPWHPGGVDPVPPGKFSCVRSQPVGAPACCAHPGDHPRQGRSKPAPLPSV